VVGTAASEIFGQVVATAASYSEVADFLRLPRYKWHVAIFSVGQPTQNAGTLIT
jgi:hypothetical protein